MPLAFGLKLRRVRFWKSTSIRPEKMRECGSFEARLDYYRVVPEWITGMGLITGMRA